MNNEEKYKLAIERARQILKNPYTAGWDKMKELIEHLFPELVEDEDEKIRKMIIEIVKRDEERIGVNAHLKKLQWLERQGPVEWSKEDGEILDFIIADAEQEMPLGKKQIEWLKLLRSQLKQPWIVVDKEIYVNEPVLAQLKDKSDAFSGYVVCNDHTLTPTKYERYVKISNIVKQHQSHWKPTKIQLEVLDRIIHFTHFDEMKGSDIFRGLYEQLKAL